MPKATWNGALIAEEKPENVKIVEGNVYFSPGAVDRSL